MKDIGKILSDKSVIGKTRNRADDHEAIFDISEMVSGES